MENSFCPFVNGKCRKDCIFFSQSKTAVPGGTSQCLIAINLHFFNYMQHDDLVEISQAIKDKK